MKNCITFAQFHISVTYKVTAYFLYLFTLHFYIFAGFPVHLCKVGGIEAGKIYLSGLDGLMTQ